MLAVSWSDFKDFGCPNCGCDYAIRDSCFVGNQPAVTCKSCNLYYQILADGLTESSVGFGTGRKDENGEDAVEYPRLIVHPRKGISKWKWEAPDSKPEYGEYWCSRGLGFDLSGFVKSKQAGERLLEMVKKVTGKEKPDSWIDWREDEPDWIQFKFQKSEFNLVRLDKLVYENKCVVTKEILHECRL